MEAPQHHTRKTKQKMHTNCCYAECKKEAVIQIVAFENLRVVSKVLCGQHYAKIVDKMKVTQGVHAQIPCAMRVGASFHADLKVTVQNKCDKLSAETLRLLTN